MLLFFVKITCTKYTNGKITRATRRWIERFRKRVIVHFNICLCRDQIENYWLNQTQLPIINVFLIRRSPISSTIRYVFNTSLIVLLYIYMYKFIYWVCRIESGLCIMQPNYTWFIISLLNNFLWFEWQKNKYSSSIVFVVKKIDHLRRRTFFSFVFSAYKVNSYMIKNNTKKANERIIKLFFSNPI